ncbi:MAG: hypothetical protein HY710_16015 [Candidatus Latescibacteria bacterium]|nr:hypothetical protein [Candidatus Latescibacterota bacterium]
MARYAVILVVLGGLVGAGCERRARVNPLDPLNPSTGGRPQNLVAVAEHRRVTLAWERLPVADLSGYRLRRSEVGGDASSVLDIPVSVEYNRYVDLQVVNGKTYQYSLTARITSGSESRSSDPVEATPGPSSCWVIDRGASALFRTSADGYAIAVGVSGFLDPATVVTDPNDGGCWTSDPLNGALVRFTADGALDVVVTGLTRPGAIDVDVRDGACWVAEGGGTIGQASDVVRVKRDGTVEFRVFAFTDPQAVAVSPMDGSCWVADLANRQVSNIGVNGDIRLAAGGFEAPIGVVADPADGGCWVIDRAAKQVVKLTRTGVRMTTVVGFADPAAGSYDATSGSLWMADPGQQAVIKLLTGIPNGYDIRQRIGFHQTITGLRTPLGVSTDAQTGDCWVADAGNRTVLKFTAGGQLLGFLALSEGSRPVAVSVDPGTRYGSSVP